MFISPPHLAQQQINGQFDISNNKLKSSGEFSNRNNLMQTSYGAPHGLNLQNGIMGQQQQTNSQQVSYFATINNSFSKLRHILTHFITEKWISKLKLIF